MANDNAILKGFAVKAFSVFIAALFLMSALVAVDQDAAVADEKEQKNTTPFSDEVKDIEITVEVFNGEGGKFQENGSDECYYNKTYTFEQVSFVEVKCDEKSLALSAESENVIIYPLMDDGYRFKFFGKEPYQQVVMSGDRFDEESVTIEVVFTDSLKPLGVAEFIKLYEESVKSSTPVVLKCDYDLNGQFVLGASMKSLMIDFNGYELLNAKIYSMQSVTFYDSYGYGGINNGCITNEYSEKFHSIIWNGGHLVAGSNSYSSGDTYFIFYLKKSCNLIVNDGCIESPKEMIKTYTAIGFGEGSYSINVTINDGLIKSDNGIYGQSKPDAMILFTMNGGIFDCNINAIGIDFFNSDYDRNINLMGGTIRGKISGVASNLGHIIISGCTIEKCDIALFVSNGEVVMFDGVIRNNHNTHLYGDALLQISGSSFSMSGGSITDNYADDYPILKTTDDSKVNLSGSIVIKDNWNILPDGTVVDGNLPAKVEKPYNIVGHFNKDSYLALSVDSPDEYHFALCEDQKFADGIVYFHSAIPEMTVIYDGKMFVLKEVAEEPCGDNLNYTIKGNTMTITGTGNKITKNDWALEGITVQRIEISNSVTSIGDSEIKGVFSGFINLKEIIIPANVNYICEKAFFGDSSVEKIVFEGQNANLSAASFWLDGPIGPSNTMKNVTVLSPGNWAEGAFTDEVTGELTNVVYTFENSDKPEEPMNFVPLIIGVLAIVVLLTAVVYGRRNQ